MEQKVSTVIDRIPHDLRLENDLLGSLLCNNKYYGLIRSLVSPEYFVDQQNATLFRIMLKFLQANKPLTESILLEYIKSNNAIEIVGGMEYLMTLQERLLDKDSVVATAKKLRELYIRRKALYLSLDLIEKCKGSHDDFVDSATTLTNKIFSLLTTGTDTNVISIHEACKMFLQELMSGEGVKMLATGFPILDILLDGGFTPGSLVVLAGRPSMGKSALAMDIAYNTSIHNYNTLVITIEMGSKELACRGLSRFSGLSFGQIRHRTFMDSDEQRQRILDTCNEVFSKIPLFFKDKAAQLEEITACIETLHHERPIDFLVIDYLQLIGISGKRDNRNAQISDITRCLKTLAVSLRFPVLLLSQLSRELERREDKRPILADLRDSGAIEQDADIVMFLYKDSVYNPQSRTPNEVELIISKNRNGRRGLVHKLEFDGKTTSFKEYEDNDTSSPVNYNDPRGNDL